ncbi:MAG: hypothetical protein VB878_01940 [Pirellulaceae bacterium]
MRTSWYLCSVGLCVVFISLAAIGGESDDYYHDGALSGSLKSSEPLPVYDDDPEHLWNRLFAAFYTRTSHIAANGNGPRVKRIEGGDYIDFLAWGGSEYWSRVTTTERLNKLLDEFLEQGGAERIEAPLKRAFLLRDLWAAYDFFAGQNIRRVDTLEVRKRRDEVCAKLSRVIQSLALPEGSIEKLPDSYSIAVHSGEFAVRQDSVANKDYLPPGLFTKPDRWVEVDFHQPDIHEDLYDRFITLHARAYRGRSYFRIFYKFPGGRSSLIEYLRRLDDVGVDWRQGAQDGFIILRKDAPQIPVGTEVALVQFMMTLDSKLRPTPTKIVESIRHRTFRNLDGSAKPLTNTGVGMHIREFTAKRQLLFDNLKRGGLAAEPEDAPLYRVIFQPDDAPDWGTNGRKVLFQQCADCHMSPKANRIGVHSMPSIVHMGGFNAGAQLGIVHTLDPSEADVHGQRVARWKTQHETYRKLLDYLGR